MPFPSPDAHLIDGHSFLIIAFYALDAVEPFHQRFSLNNYTLQYPYAEHERVPIWMLVAVAVLCPAAVIAVYTLVIDGLFSHQQPSGSSGRRRPLTGSYRLKDRLWELNCGILGLLLSVGAAFVITGALKNAIGKPRPDLLDRCRPKEGSFDAPAPSYGLSTHAICTRKNNAILKDGFRSFPSGHSSTAFAGLFYLSLYLAAKMHVLDSKGEVWKTLVILIPVLGAALVAGSRIMDARHHPFDVISGSLLGILVAWGSYRQYFPPVSETWRKGRAYPIRSWGREPVPPDPLARADEGVEPLRAPAFPADEEQRIGYSTATGSGNPEDAAHQGNVFRQQISASQRRRQEAAYDGAPAAASGAEPARPAAQRMPSSSYSSQPPSSAPVPRTTGGHRRRRLHDGYWSSSSDDEAAADELELQPTYTLSDPQGHGGAYGPVADALGGHDTAYHPQRMTSVRVPSTVAERAERDGMGAVPPGPILAGEGLQAR